ncbi:LGFP repeat-containing protein, partial [Nocardia jejuensis]|uniref:LGFP repeat-containing protein n=1 Tax=Nocardia jejuensis TaxID=328049 RepID=UPI00350E50C4
MTVRKKSKCAAATSFGFALTLGAGVLLGPSAFAQPAGSDTAIVEHYNQWGGASSPLGAAQGTVYAFGADGAAQDYQGGKIVYSPETGARVMYGVILDKYLLLGGGNSDIGYPRNDESDSSTPGAARFNEFSAPDGATMYWSPETGAWLVRGPIRSAWSALGATNGVLGSPTTDTTVVDGVYSQTFAGKDGNPVEVRWSKEGGFVTVPPEIAAQLSGLDVSVPGQAPGAVVSGAVPPPSAASDPNASDNSSEAASDSDDKDSNSKWWALPIGLVIAGAAGFLASKVRGGSGGSGASGAHAQGATATGGPAGPRPGGGVGSGAGGAATAGAAGSAGAAGLSGSAVSAGSAIPDSLGVGADSAAGSGSGLSGRAVAAGAAG